MLFGERRSGFFCHGRSTQAELCVGLQGVGSPFAWRGTCVSLPQDGSEGIVLVCIFHEVVFGVLCVVGRDRLWGS